MRAIVALAAAAVLAPLAVAQEGPPAVAAKHENKVSAAAQALLDEGRKHRYSPVEMGLKELKGTVEQKREMAGMPDMPKMPDMPNVPNMPKMQGMGGQATTFSVSFTAPSSVTVEIQGEGPPGPAMVREQMVQGMRRQLLASLGVDDPGPTGEFDMDVETEGGKKVLVTTSYDHNVKQGTTRMYFSAEGLPEKQVFQMDAAAAGGPGGGRGPGGPGGGGMEMTFQFRKDGDRGLLEKTTMKHPMMRDPMETTFTYADAGGFKLAVGWSSSGMMGMKIGSRFTDLAVNGKKVDVPAPAAGDASGPAKMPVPPKRDGKMGDPDHEGREEGDEDDEKGEKDEHR
jgi:hypothetical protein